MALIRLNIDSFKRDLGGIANRLVDDAVNRIENKLENAVEDAFTKGLNKIGLSNNLAREISSRFTDSIAVGRADEFFRESTSEQNRVSRREIAERLLAGVAETTFDAVQSIDATNNKNTNANVLQFPDQLGKYYMMLDFQRYSRPSPQMEAIFRRFQTIALPIPRDLKESFDIDITGKAQGVGGGLADIGVDLLRGAGENVRGQFFALAYSGLVQKTEGLGAADVIGQLAGAVPNPHLQAIFSGVELREHTFQWTFAPRNPNESAMLMRIIRELKQNSLPAYSTQGTAALQYPPMVDVKLMFKQFAGLNEPSAPQELDMIQFKKCLVKNVSVNYAPAGLPSFFKGTRHPTMIQLELQFLETEIQTANDYGLAKGAATSDRLTQVRTKIEETLKAGGEGILDPLLGAGTTQTVINSTNEAGNSVLRSISKGASDVVPSGTTRQ